jgi:hypothetical protein
LSGKALDLCQHFVKQSGQHCAVRRIGQALQGCIAALA